MNEARTVPPLRIAVLGDFEGMHTRRWLEVFVERGHDMHAISFYRPHAELPGVTLHVLAQAGAAPSAGGSTSSRGLRRLVPASLLRLVHARRYLRAGLRRVLDEVSPDVFHAHYAVEHGFYGSFAGFHPYVVSAWGSDLLVESHKLSGRLIAQRALGRADLVTANDQSLARRATELGVPANRLEVVHLGIDRVFLEAGEHSINLRPEAGQAPTIISNRALEPLYNIDVVLTAFARLKPRLPAAKLIVAGRGTQEDELRNLASSLGVAGSVDFMGQQDAGRLANLLASSHVFVSVPGSDSLALSTVEAMAAGSFPVVSDLPSNEGWITHGENGLTVPAGDPVALAGALQEALSDDSLRRIAARRNREKAEREGLRERNMLLMERHYYRLAGHPQAGSGEAI